MIDGDSSPGSRSSSSESFDLGAFIIRYLRSRAARVALSIVLIESITSGRSARAALFASRTASEAKTSSTGRRPLTTIVEPVETRSTMASARPRRGATSAAPATGMTSTGRARPPGAGQRREGRGGGWRGGGGGGGGVGGGGGRPPPPPPPARGGGGGVE